MNIKVAYYARTDAPGTLEIAYHRTAARDLIVKQTEAAGARFRYAMDVSLDELVRRGAVGPKTAADWTKRCALRGAVRALGL